MFYLLEFGVALLLCFIVIYTFLIYYFYEVVLVNVLSPYEYLMTVEDITQESFDVILDKGLEATQSKKFDKDILTYLCLYAVCFLDKNVVMPKAIMESMYDFITNQNKPLVHSFFVELLLVRLYGAMRQSDVPLILETQEMIIAYAETLDKRKKAKKPIFFIKRLRRDIERVKNQQLEDIKLNRDFRRFLKQRNLL